MKYLKSLIVLIVAGVIVCLILAGTYSAVTSLNIGDVPIEQTSAGPQVQILSPQNDTTYQINKVMLNITASDAVARVTYFLELDGEYTYKVDNSLEVPKMTLYEISTLSGDSNITYTEPTEFFRLYNGAHVLYVYAFDVNDNVVDCQSIIFTISAEIPKGYLTHQELQTTISYFESQGLTVGSPASKYSYVLNGGVVHCVSAEEFVDTLKTHGLSRIDKLDYSPDISFCSCGPGCLPVVYCFSVTIV
ncbi:hypothetical protein [Candidatus Bathycorpusculum sp.]|uniref:hypothetical protein n=1 Tax=Candidatus Bathycorpusculum sp. TaxID=2994959 RepID=UPI00281CE0FE|nr:hypothetical protein [Candidatus Termitimicrobium sp.]MCL2685967.1 hypothetical protein [Candidatus Termitimicrobium sp.]